MPPLVQPTESKRWLGHFFSIWLVAALLIVAFWVHTSSLITEDRAHTLASAENNLLNLGRVSQEHAERTFYGADQTLRLLIAEYAEHKKKIDLKTLVAHGAFDSRIYLQFAIIDAQGLLSHSSLPFTGRIDLSDRAHFKAHLSNSPDALYISPPVLGRASGKWSIQLSRRITDENGKFDGVVVASLDPTYFTLFYKELLLGEQGIVALFGTDGAVLARRTENQQAFTGDLSASPVFKRFAEGDEASTIAYRSISDGIERIHHFRKLPSYPLIVGIGVSNKDVFATHEEYKAQLLQQAAFITLLFVVLAAIASLNRAARLRHSVVERQALVQLQNITRRVPGVVYQYLLRPDGTSCFPFASEGMLDIYGVTPEEVIHDAAKVFTLIHPEDLAELNESIHVSARQLTPWVHEYRVCLADQSIRWLSGRAIPEQRDDGSVLWNGFIADATQRKQAEESLITLSAAVEQSPVSIIITDPAGIIQYVNPTFEQITGYTRAEVIGQNPRIISANEKAPEKYQAMWATLLAGKIWRGEFRNRHKDGTLSWERAVISPVFNDRGVVIHFIANEEDVTEHKRIEERLRIAATAFESQEGMFITDAENVILRVNQAFSRITGYEAEEAIGNTPSLLSSGRHDGAFYSAMHDAIAAEGVWQGEIWNRRKNGEVFPEWLTITAVRNEAGELTHHVSTITDITQRKAAESEINHLAFYDPLTRLPNRRLLSDRLRQAMAASSRSECEGALLFIDLDHFKTLNDTLGHHMGDLLLQEVARRLTACVREGDTVARLGGDEFVVMLEDLSKRPREAAAQTETIGEKILYALNLPFDLAGHDYHSTPSIGITLFTDHQNSSDELMKRADLAMYQAKAAGRNTLRFFDPDMQAAVNERAGLERDLRCALQENQLVLFYQAQVDGDGTLTGAESLVRWQHPQRGMVSPIEFIPLAEETGLILPLGHWVLETACKQLAVWAGDAQTAHLTIAVNVSARQFRQPAFVAEVLAVLEQTGANPERLKLEQTESLLLEDVEDIIQKMTELKARGVGFSLDDFGTGYSSLSYLKRLPLDQLKIDQSFVRDLLIDPNDAAIARTIVALAGSLGMSVIAEGVETEAQRIFLAGLGCHAYQGYYFGRPGPIEALIQTNQTKS